MKTIKKRFYRLLSLANGIARREGAEPEQELLRLTIALFLRQEREIYSEENRYYADIAGRDPNSVANLVDWWTEKGEDSFWARRKGIVCRVRNQFSQEQCLEVKNALQGALAFEDEHRHHALKAWRLEEQHEDTFELWVVLHAFKWMACRFQARFSANHGGIFP